MLTVDPEKRITVEGCLQHPWTTGHEIPPTQIATSMSSIDSTDGLVGQFQSQLDFSKRKPVRERTLLSALNDVRVTRVIDLQGDAEGSPQPSIKVFEKNKGPHHMQPSQRQGKGQEPATTTPVSSGATTVTASTKNGKKGKPQKKEVTPAHNRAPEEFIMMGGKGDQPIFGDDSDSRYISPEKEKEIQEHRKQQQKKKRK